MFNLSRMDRVFRTYNVVATLGSGTPDPVAGVDVAVVAPRSTPGPSTVWTAATWTSPNAVVLLAGPDADATGAVVVPLAGADLWIRVTDTPEVQAVRVERVLVV